MRTLSPASTQTQGADTTPLLWRHLTAFSLALFALMLLWGAVGDGRMVNGAPVWQKPAKFALSFVVLFGTIALVTDRLSPKVRNGWPVFLIGLSMAVTMIVEMGWIIRQAARGVDSHFNMATPLEAFMYTTVMFAGAVYLVLAVGVLGWIAKRDRTADMGSGLREGVWLGFLLSFVLTLVIATYIGGNGSRVGLAPDGSPTVPFFGWSGVIGDLRPAHFLALHAMQVLPLIGLWMDRRRISRAVRTVRIAATVWVALTVAVFVQGLAGIPLVRL